VRPPLGEPVIAQVAEDIKKNDGAQFKATAK
jgi:hypothetical protein